MSFLIRYVATDEVDGVVHDETVVAGVRALSGLEKDLHVLGRRVTLRIEFDPALVPDPESAPLTLLTLVPDDTD